MRSDCKVCNTLSVLDEEDHTALSNALKDNDVSKTDIARVMTDNGFPVSETSVRRHIKNHGSKGS